MESRWRGWRGCRSPRRQHRSSFAKSRCRTILTLRRTSYLVRKSNRRRGVEVGQGKPMAVLFDSGERPTRNDAVVSHHHPVLAFHAFSLEVSNERINNGLEFAVHN